MDGLALLCNLHADGPRTLRRLRQAGVHTLGDLEGLTERRLADCLADGHADRIGSAQAHRFLQEGRQLSSRLAEAPLEPEERHEPVPDPGFRSLGDLGQPELLECPTFEPQAHEPPVSEPKGIDVPETFEVFEALDALHPGALPALDERTLERLASEDVTTLQSLVEQANLSLSRRTGIPFPKLLQLSCQARRLLDERGAPGGVGPAPAGPEPASELAGVEVMCERSDGRGAPLLEAGAIEGLDDEVCERVREQGVRTFQELVEQADLTLARRTGIPFTKLLDLASLARGFLARQDELQPAPLRRMPSLAGLSLASRGPRRSAPVWRAWVTALPAQGQESSPAIVRAPADPVPADPSSAEPVLELVPEERNAAFAAASEEPGVGGPFG